MADTVLLKRSGAMTRRPLERCHEGKGVLDFTAVLGGEAALEDRSLRFFHDDVLPPGTSIGFHRHTGDEEYYYILSGTGTMRLNDETYKVGPGDLAAVFPGGAHALANTGDSDMRIIVISVTAPE